MRIKRTLPVLIAVLAIAAAVVAIVQLRKRAPPEAVRLLPGADGFFYINLKWIRTFNATNQLPPVSRDPDYQKFVEETGFQFERDLDEAGFAVHYPGSWGNGTTGGSATEPRFSEIFVGKIDANVKNGAFNDVDLWYELRRAVALVKRTPMPTRTEPVRTQFKTLAGSAMLANGVARNDDLTIDMDYLKAHGKGTLNITTQAVDYRVIAEIYKLPSEGAGSEIITGKN